MLAGIALAGGRSSRMGEDKGLLPLPNTKVTLLNHCQQLLSALGAIKVWVSGIQHQQGIPDIYPNCGPMSGIHGTLFYLTKHEPLITEMLFVPVDMPALSPRDLHLLIEQGRLSNSLCCYENHYFPLYMPISEELVDYIERQLFLISPVKLLGKNRQLSMRRFLAEFSAKQIKPDNEGSLININTPAQWQHHCAGLTVTGN